MGHCRILLHEHHINFVMLFDKSVLLDKSVYNLTTFTVRPDTVTKMASNIIPVFVV